MKKLNFLWLLIPIFIIYSCDSYSGQYFDNPSTQVEIDQNKIIDYLKANNINAQRTEEGIYYVVEKKGTGNYPTVDSVVQVHYKGYFLNDTTFDSSYDRNEPAIFLLGQVVDGWKKGMPLFNEGSKGKLFIPSHLAYGEKGAGNVIAPNSVICFDIELINIMDKAEIEAFNEKKIKEQAEVDEKIIQEYLANNNIEAKRTEDGIYYIMESEGGSQKPTLQDKVKVHYEGTLLDGTKFDSSYDRGEPAEFPLAGVVPGWQKGIPLFGKGGKGTLLIPSGLAYGPRGTPSIPPNTVLKFKVELLDISGPPVK